MNNLETIIKNSRNCKRERSKRIYQSIDRQLKKNIQTKYEE